MQWAQPCWMWSLGILRPGRAEVRSLNTLVIEMSPVVDLAGRERLSTLTYHPMRLLPSEIADTIDLHVGVEPVLGFTCRVNDQERSEDGTCTRACGHLSLGFFQGFVGVGGVCRGGLGLYQPLISDVYACVSCPRLRHPQRSSATAWVGGGPGSPSAQRCGSTGRTNLRH